MMRVLRSDQIITSTGIIDGFLLMEGGRIVEILKEQPESATEYTDLRGRCIMPGIIDPHVHINEPGRTEWEGFDTATRAAIAGGITTLVEMPLNSSPVTTSLAALEQKIRAANGRIHCNCSFWGGVVPGNEKEIEPMIEAGVPGFKAFLVHSGIDEFPASSEEDLRKVMPLLAKHQKPLLVHCELESPINSTPGLNARSYQAYLRSRPAKWEDDAIALMIRLCEEFNCPVHIVHLSSAGSIEQIRRAKSKGLPLTVETAQHYLYFSADEIPDGQTSFKCAPPIRERENNERLWEALVDGTIDFVATDHSPAPPDLKETLSGDLQKAWGGIASLQFSLSILWTIAKRKGADTRLMAKWLCEMPAKLPGFKSRGKIEEGFNADLVVWNTEKKILVSEEMILHRHKMTPYNGEELLGAVEQVYLAGELVFDRGNFLHLNKGKLL